MKYRPQNVQESRVLLQADLDDAYDAFFKKKLKEYGVDDPGDLSDEEKKKFFNEIELEWEEGKGPTEAEKTEAAVRKASPGALDSLKASEEPNDNTAPTAPAPMQDFDAPSFAEDPALPAEVPEASDLEQSLKTEMTSADADEAAEVEEEEEGEFSTDDLDMDQRMDAVAEVASSLDIPVSAKLAIEEAAEAVSKISK